MLQHSQLNLYFVCLIVERKHNRKTSFLNTNNNVFNWFFYLFGNCYLPNKSAGLICYGKILCHFILCPATQKYNHHVLGKTFKIFKYVGLKLYQLCTSSLPVFIRSYFPLFCVWHPWLSLWKILMQVGLLSIYLLWLFTSFLTVCSFIHIWQCYFSIRNDYNLILDKNNFTTCR